MGLIARLGNGGTTSVLAGVEMAFYDGDPGMGGSLIGVAVSTNHLEPGRYEDLRVEWAGPSITN